MRDTIYKLFSVRKDGSLGPLFINRRQRIPIGKWMWAKCHPTKGFAVRKGWHGTFLPVAPHLSRKGRVWCECEIRHWTTYQRPYSQGGAWALAQRLRVIAIRKDLP